MTEVCDLRCARHPGADAYLSKNTQPHAHYGKWLCVECDRFIKHARTPKTNGEMSERQEQIVKLLVAGGLAACDVEDLCRLYGAPHLNLAQQSKYMAVIGKYQVQ